MLEILSKDFLNWSKFSRFEIQTTAKSKIMIRNTGNRVIKDKDWKINNKYTDKKIKDRKKTVLLKTAIIDKEWIKSLKKLIFDGPKYLGLLIVGIETRFWINLVNEPEKLNHVDGSWVILKTESFGKKV